jgi:alpha-1,6-mannosyltransferase
MRALTFCDLAMFYCPTGGGVRTYYDAKLEWFRRQTTHRYVLIVPGERVSIRQLTPFATVIVTAGVCVGRGPDSYRLFSDFSGIRSAIGWCRPDVLETGDPWVSGPLALWTRRRDRLRTLVSSFFHADPIPTYLEPAASRYLPPRVVRALGAVATGAFHRLQRLYDATMTSSEEGAERLRRAGIANVGSVPFGVDPVFFEIGERRRWSERSGRRLLYAGRLDRDKHVDRLIAILPRLLDSPDVFVTVAGTGALQNVFERWTHPRLRYAGYVREREGLARLYGEHDVFLAPGPYETFGLAALEAAAAGLVIVGPDQGGTGSLLRQMQSPFAFRSGDARDFLAAARAAAASAGSGPSAASRRVAARYGTWPESIERLANLYEHLCASFFCRSTT